MVSHPETGSDSPIGSDRDRGRDNQHMRSRGLDRGKKSETLSLFFFPLIYYHILMPRVLPLFIICLELISTIGSSGIFKY